MVTNDRSDRYDLPLYHVYVNDEERVPLPASLRSDLQAGRWRVDTPLVGTPDAWVRSGGVAELQAFLRQYPDLFVDEPVDTSAVGLGTYDHVTKTHVEGFALSMGLVFKQPGDDGQTSDQDGSDDDADT